MPLKLPPLKAASSTIADWVEIRALADPAGSFRLSRIKRFWDTHRESEDADPEGLHAREDDTDEQGVSGADDDAFLDALTDELAERSRALGGMYPFDIAASGLTLSLKPDLSIGQVVYLFCLLLTNSREGDILSGAWEPAIDNQVRDLFQACSTVAAAGEIRGCAVSFGWPRPDENPPFLHKLRQVYDRFGEGVPVPQPRPGASLWAKDEEIDVIAWRPRLDGAAGTAYMLGQVASGDNWEAKSIKGGPIDYFHRTWFDPAPPSTPIPSIFIPHAVPPFSEGTRRERMDLLVARFGTIFDRLRLPLLTSEGQEFAVENPELLIERVTDLQQIGPWVNSQISALRAAGKGPL